MRYGQLVHAWGVHRTDLPPRDKIELKRFGKEYGVKCVSPQKHRYNHGIRNLNDEIKEIALRTYEDPMYRILHLPKELGGHPPSTGLVFGTLKPGKHSRKEEVEVDRIIEVPKKGLINRILRRKERKKITEKVEKDILFNIPELSKVVSYPVCDEKIGLIRYDFRNLDDSRRGSSTKVYIIGEPRYTDQIREEVEEILPNKEELHRYFSEKVGNFPRKEDIFDRRVDPKDEIRVVSLSEECKILKEEILNK